MVLIDVNMEIDLGFFLGLAGLILSAVAMFRTGKLEKQQLELNEYALEEKKKEKEASKHANLKLYGTSSDLRCYMQMKIENVGKCDAEYVDLTILNKSLKEHPEGLSFDGTVPTRIAAGESYEFGLFCYTGEEELKVRVSWEDGLGPWSPVRTVQIKCKRD